MVGSISASLQSQVERVLQSSLHRVGRDNAALGLNRKGGTKSPL